MNTNPRIFKAVIIGAFIGLLASLYMFLANLAGGL